jgi:gliding motility-associated-like protein
MISRNTMTRISKRMDLLRSLLGIVALWLLSTHLCSPAWGQTLLHTYGDPNVDDYGTTIIAAPSGNLIVGGSRANEAIVMMFTPLGQVEWAYHFPAPSAARQKIGSLAMTPDGFLIGTGNSDPDPNNGHRHNGFIFKMDLMGNLLWARQETHAAPVYFDKIVPISASEYLVSCVYEYLNTTWIDVLLAKVDASDGSITSMSRRFDLGPNNYLDDPEGLAIAPNGDIYLTGRLYTVGVANNSMRPYLLRLDANLNLVWGKYYMFPAAVPAREYGVHLIASGSELVMLTCGNRLSGSVNFTVGLLKTDLDGNVLWHYDYDILGSDHELSWGFSQNLSGFNIVGFTDQSWLFSLQTDDNGVPLWTKRISPSTNWTELDNWAAAVTHANSQVWFTGVRSMGGRQLLLGSMDMQGETDCDPTGNITPIVTTIPPYVQAVVVADYAESLPMAPKPPMIAHSVPSPCSTAPWPDLGPDTTLCGATYMLDATVPGTASYLWSDGSTSPTLVATASGIYTVAVRTGCCLTADTIVLGLGQFQVALGPDRTICSGDTVPLTAGPVGWSYSWSTGYTTPTIVATTPGSYAVTVTTLNGCMGADTVLLLTANLPTLDLGADQERCGEDGLVLRSSLQGLAYAWSTGATTDSIYVDTTGTYALTVTTDCGDVTDAVFINLIKEDKLFIPNVFTPNGDGIHDDFKIEGPVYDGYDLAIFDRWGRRLFSSRDITQSWDGQLRGVDCPAGVYFYALRVLNCDRDLAYKAGSVTLVR